MVATSGWVWPEDFSRSSNACGDKINFSVYGGMELKATCCATAGAASPTHLFAERDCNFIPALGRVLDDQVVERSKAGRNLVAALLGCCCCTAVVRLGH